MSDCALQPYGFAGTQSYVLDLGAGRSFDSGSQHFLGAGFAPVPKLSLSRMQHALQCRELTQFFNGACRRFEGSLFMVVAPCRHLKGDCIAPFDLSDNGPHGSLGYLQNASPAVQQCLDWRERCSSFEDWIVGVCARPFEAPRDVKDQWTLEGVLDQADRISAMSLFFADANEHVVLTRRYPGVDTDLDGLMANTKEL